MNPNELKLALEAMQFNTQDAARGPVPDNFPASYLLQYKKYWCEYIKSRRLTELLDGCKNKSEALYLAVQDFDAYLCGIISKTSPDAASVAPLYLGIRRAVQRVFDSGIFPTFEEVRGSADYISDETGFGTKHQLILRPVNGTVAHSLLLLKLTPGQIVGFPNVGVTLTHLDREGEEQLEVAVQTRVNVPLPKGLTVTALCGRVRGSSPISRYQGIYL